jgi:hypothetical protein
MQSKFIRTIFANFSLIFAFLSLENHVFAAMLPKFKAAGQSFWMSTGCSPHSASLRLDLNADVLIATEIKPHDSLTVLTLNYNNGEITVRTSDRYNSHELPGKTKLTVLHPNLVDEAAAYQKASLDLQQIVSSLKDGNVCFPAQPLLSDVLDYVQSLLASLN